MKKLLHMFGAIIATLCIATFFSSSLLTELFGSPAQVATVKSLIVFPGLWLLIPAMIATGASGSAMGRAGKLVQQKQKRMKIVAANGLLILLPCALVLNSLAAAGEFTLTFYLLRVLELLSGAGNLVLMGLNIRDGLKLSGRGKKRQPSTLTGK